MDQFDADLERRFGDSGMGKFNYQTFNANPQKRFMEPSVRFFFDFLRAECRNPYSSLSQFESSMSFYARVLSESPFVEKAELERFIESIYRLANAYEMGGELSYAERDQCIDSLKSGMRLLRGVSEHYQYIYDKKDIENMDCHSKKRRWEGGNNIQETKLGAGLNHDGNLRKPLTYLVRKVEDMINSRLSAKKEAHPDSELTALAIVVTMSRKVEKLIEPLLAMVGKNGPGL